MKKLVIAATLLTLGSVAFGQEVRMRGAFTAAPWDFSGPVLTLVSGTTYDGLATGLVTGTDYEFKVATEDWSVEAPAGSNLRARVNAAGNLHVRYFDEPAPTDGWLPNGRRAGLLDLDLGYELIGNITGWGFGIALNNTANLFSGTVQLQNEYGVEYKYRGIGGDWAYNIGDGFGQNNNATFTTTVAGAHLFEVDVPNGRYRVTAGTNLVSGTVTLGNYVGSAFGSDKVLLTAHVFSGATEVQTVPVLVTPVLGTGSYTLALNSDLSGSVTIKMEGPTWLKQSATTTVVPNGAATVNFTLLNGDSVKDGIVDLSDYTVIVTAFNADPLAGNWNVAADLNRDDIVDLTDYTVVVSNFNAQDN